MPIRGLLVSLLLVLLSASALAAQQEAESPTGHQITQRVGADKGGASGAKDGTTADADQGANSSSSATSPADEDRAVDFATTDALLDLGPYLSADRVRDPAHPDAAWFTVLLKNNGIAAASRILVADDPPGAGLALMPYPTRPILREAAASDSSVVIERATAYGPNAFRVTLPPAHSATLALHLEGVHAHPSLLAWNEQSLVAHNGRAALLTGVVGGLLAAIAAFAIGNAVLSGCSFNRWAALFLTALLTAYLAQAGLFDGGWFSTFGGPYGLVAFMLALAVAAGARLVDQVAPFDAAFSDGSLWVDRVLIGVIAFGAAAALGVPGVGLLVRVVTVVGAGSAAGYLAHYGRLGRRGAQRLAPAATVFALVTAAATFHALGLMPPNQIAPSAISGFAAAGAMLVALVAAAPGFGRAPAGMRDGSASLFRAPTETNEDVEAHGREHAAMAAALQGVFDLDLMTGLLSLSDEGAAILGFPDGAMELPREGWLQRIYPEDRPVYEEALRTYRGEPGTAFRLEFRARGGSGGYQWFELRATMIGQSSEAERCLGLIADVTSRKASESEHAQAAQNDVLTGLGNRTALLGRLEGLGAPLGDIALMVFDIDRFKLVNTSLGPDGADLILRAVAGRLSAYFRRGTELYRIGGDTFVILAETGIEAPLEWAQGAVEQMKEPFLAGEREVFLTASAGVATGEDAGDATDLLYLAELAMIQAKREAGGHTCAASPALAEAADRQADPVVLEAELRRAMERAEIEIHYQPIIRLADNSVAGFEALMRWRHPERGTVSPDDFVGHSEETGLIQPLGKLALKRAAADLTRWQQFFPLKQPIFVSVNVSWRQITNSGFLRDIEAILKASGLPRGSVKLEMTESAVMADAGAAEQTLERLRDLGVGLAIDDFGTGQSSLSHLRRFPFEVIKIDRSFLSASRHDGSRTILASIVTLAHELGLEVIAEGVEDEKDARDLRALGSEYAQGYFFGAPVSAAEVTSYIAMTYAQPDLSAAGSRD